MTKKLPEAQQATATATLWQKAQGKCALCGEPFPADNKGITADHITATVEGDGGDDLLANLYLAHSRCNSSRRNLPFDLARRVIRFAKWCDAAPPRNFNDVAKKYVTNPFQKPVYVRESDHISVSFGSDIRVATVSTDPATGTEYFFMNVPVAYIQNDAETQPRVIEHDHVRTLAVDFTKHPVHEPSNCRFVTGEHDTVDLLQFDGQHKTTAQVILGRPDVPMKLYIDPAEPMIQELVVQIQQGIKKRPLSTTDTLKKLDDVVQDKIAAYEQQNGKKPSEQSLVAFQPKQDQLDFKKRLLGNIEHLIISDERNQLSEFASKKKVSDRPYTDTVLVRRVVRPLVSQELVDTEPIHESTERDRERGMALHILNRIAEQMLIDRWAPDLEDDIATRRARNFFYQGAIGFWMTELLLPVIKLNLSAANRARLLRNSLSDADLERIETAVDVLCGWEIWSTADKEQLDALRSNTVSNVSAAFPEYTLNKLMMDVSSQLDQTH